MKKVACIPISSVSSVKIIVTECKKTLDQVKSETGADYILNGGMWNEDGTPYPEKTYDTVQDGVRCIIGWNKRMNTKHERGEAL